MMPFKSLVFYLMFAIVACAQHGKSPTNENRINVILKDSEKFENYHERTYHKNHHRRKTEPHQIDSQNLDIKFKTFSKRNSADVIQNNITNEHENFNINEDLEKKARDAGIVNNGTTIIRKAPQRIDDSGYPDPTVDGMRVCVHRYNKVARAEKNIEEVTHRPSAVNYEYDAVEYNDYDNNPRRIWAGHLEDGSPVKFEECAHSTDSCYALWQQADNGTIVILGQGCWEASASTSNNNDCLSHACTHSIVQTGAQPPGSSNLTSRTLPSFCCCTGDSCNSKPETTIAIATKSSQSSSPVAPANGAATGTRSAPIMAAATLAAVAAFAALALAAFACRRRWYGTKNGRDAENPLKGDGYESHGDGSSSDILATGLLCVDNLKLIEPIGAGRFGCVWRGTLGSKSVAVKIFPSGPGTGHWQREKDIYSLPHIKHPNVLKFYGSDIRQNMSGSRETLLVMELASIGTLRAFLREGPPLELWQFVNMALGLASAVAHLHMHIENNGSYKPCVAHRDINSNNVLIRGDLSICLADFGLAMVLPHRHMTELTQHSDSSYKITEAGTLRYLAPEALEGALDLRSAGAALRAVDVYALSLVLWELLLRVNKITTQPTSAGHQLPYQHAGVPEPPTLEIMQSVVSRRKIRPPFPRVNHASDALEQRILQMACETCSECWDHDAEARLTAVCVRERLVDAKAQMMAKREASDALQGQPGSRGINQLRENDDDSTSSAVLPIASDYDKNCNTSNALADQRTPLLYPLPHQGRNPCLERNLVTVSDSDPSEELIDKSLKDTVSKSNSYGTTNLRNGTEDCLSVARGNAINRTYEYNTNQENSIDRYSEVRLNSQRPSTPIDYVQNDVSLSSEPYYNGRAPIKQTNLMHNVKIEQPKWGSNIRKFFQKRKKSNPPLDTEVKLVRVTERVTKTNVIKPPSDCNLDDSAQYRPSNLTIESAAPNIWAQPAVCTISPPNQTVSQNMMLENQIKPDSKMFSYRELPESRRDEPAQVFAVIVPKAKYPESKSAIEMQEKPSLDIYKMEDTKDSIDSITKNSVKSSKSEHSLINTSNSESEDSGIRRKRSSCDDKILRTLNDDNIDTRYIDIDYDTDAYIHQNGYHPEVTNVTAFGQNTDCSSSSEDEHLMLLSEDGGNKITMQCRIKSENVEKNNKIASSNLGSLYGKYIPKTRYSNLDNELSGDNPVYVATLNGTFDCAPQTEQKLSPRPSLKRLSLSRQRSLEHVGDLFSSSVDLSHLRNPSDRVKTPGDVPPSVRRVRRDRAFTNGMQKPRIETAGNRLSLYDDRMMFGNSL